ncbi:PREDICTED: RWD domain-containing protein 4 [Nicrophorus vespilloides]|uniref:RWD domain-containing protein 4 n=1 Tax=Nicrophorus vespilloides TaxID=110193 RepID=A0ABM1MH86_NICVS|nr:PREDICTED: RWD domain-containing protein 4 [Nicrophorus vespilloides]
MSNLEVQEEEREVLFSIYDGDDNFKQLSPTVYQYKYGVHDDHKSFLMEIQWSENYPEEKPMISMDAFYNRNIVPTLKEKIVKLVEEEAEQFLGMSMTYSLFEFLKEKFDELIAEQPDGGVVEQVTDATEKLNIEDKPSEKKEKKEQLTKAQKRRQWDKVDNKGEKPRGWNWMDIVKHLSQTGYKEPSPVPIS